MDKKSPRLLGAAPALTAERPVDSARRMPSMQLFA